MIINGLTEKIIGAGSKDNLWELSTTMVDGFRSQREFLAFRVSCAVSSFEKGAQSAPYENLRVLRFFVVNILLMLGGGVAELDLCGE